MNAVVVPAPGGPEVLELRDLPIPALPSPHHLRVRLHAAGINPVDFKMRRRGTLAPDRLPAILGCDGAGVVDAVGSAVTRFRSGDEVFFYNGGIGLAPGNYAEFTVIHEEYAAARPQSLSMEEAAALPLVFITDWEALFDRALLRAGQTVLIHGGAGGTGHIAVQLAQARGLRVAATVRGEERAAWVRSLGAEKTIDYSQEDFVQAALEWTGGRGVDAVYDTVGGETFARSLGAARIYGQVVTLLEPVLSKEEVSLAKLRNLSLSYEMMLAPEIFHMHDARVAQRHMLDEAARMADAGQLKIKVAQVLPLEQAAEAHRAIEAGRMTGKLVLRIG